MEKPDFGPYREINRKGAKQTGEILDSFITIAKDHPEARQEIHELILDMKVCLDEVLDRYLEKVQEMIKQ